jgi:hypothetical protein
VKVAEIDPTSLKGEPDDALLSLHLRLHQLFAANFAGNDKLSTAGMTREEVVNAELLVQAEMARRGMKHEADDELAREAEALRRSTEKGLAPIHPSGEDRGDVLRLDDVLPHFRSFKLRMPFLYLVGGLANKGETKNDIDLLLRGPVPEEMRRVIEFRLGRMLPAELSSRIQLHDDDLGGPFTSHVELADLVVEMRPRFEVKQMRLDKADDPLLDWPTARGPRPACLQYHFRGKSVHVDLRFQVTDYLVGWTLAVQIAGAVPDVSTVEEARRIADAFDANGSRYNKPIVAPAKVYASPKSREPLEWLDIKGAVYEPGSVGATRFEEGVIVEVDRPKVEWGLQKPYSHEYFLTGGKHVNGILFFRMLQGGREEGGVPAGETFWTAFVSKEALPSVLNRRAVETKSMPPDGKSGLPATLESAVPAEFRYWTKKGEEARKVRDALVDARVFTADSVKVVDGLFRHVTTKMFVGREPERAAVFRGPAFDREPEPVGPEEVPALAAGAFAYVIAGDPFELALACRAVKRRGGDWAIDAPDSPYSLASLAEVGRPFRSGGRAYAASVPVDGEVEWIEVAEPVEKQPRRVPFALSWQFWKGPTVVRAAPSRQVWRFLLGGDDGLRGWELAADPTANDRAAGVRRDFPNDDLLTFEGDVPPGEKVGGVPLNETKNTPSTIAVVDRGVAEVLDEQAGFFKLRLSGRHLKGIFTLVAEGAQEAMWTFARGELPARTAKAESVGPLKLADGTTLANVQFWDPEGMSDADDKGGDRERLRPLAIFQPMKVAPRATNEFRRLDEVAKFATPEALKAGIVVDPKYNGYRFVAEKDAGGRILCATEDYFTRRKTPLPNYAANLPGVAADLKALPGPFVLDGELMAFEGDQPVQRADLARYRATTGPVDDSAVRVMVFRALYLPKHGNLAAQAEEDNRALVEAFLRRAKHFAPAPYRLAKSEVAFHDAIAWASKEPGSEGAMLKLASSNYSLGGESDAWAKLRSVRTVNAIVYQRDPVKDSPGVYNFHCAVGPIPASSRDEWESVVEVRGKLYVPVGKTFNSAVEADVGDCISVDVREIMDDRRGGKRVLTWYVPAVVGPVDRPSTVAEVEELLESGETRKLSALDREIPLLKTAEERFVLGIVLEPETVDAQNDIYSAEEIRLAAHRFMEEFGGLGLMHRQRVNDRVKVLESYVAPCDFEEGGQKVKKGTWILAVRVLDDEMWRAVKEGKLTGFSIGGTGIRRPEPRGA